MLKEPLTQSEYLKDPNHCPACGGENIAGEEVTIDNGTAHQTVMCVDCGAVWTDYYKLVSYELCTY